MRSNSAKCGATFENCSLVFFPMTMRVGSMIDMDNDSQSMVT